MGKAGKGCGCLVLVILIALIANSREFGWIFGFVGTAILAVWAIIAGIAHDLTAPSQPNETHAEIVAVHASSHSALIQAHDYRLVETQQSGGFGIGGVGIRRGPAPRTSGAVYFDNG